LLVALRAVTRTVFPITGIGSVDCATTANLATLSSCQSMAKELAGIEMKAFIDQVERNRTFSGANLVVKRPQILHQE
jgi:hypothetical protein